MEIVATRGEIGAHLFENPRAGVKRDLYWHIGVELEPVRLFGEVWDTSLRCEWLTWPVRSLDDLHGIGLAQLRNPEFAEASIYLYSEHHPIEITRLIVQRNAGGGFSLDAAGSFDVALDGERLAGPFHIKCDLSFIGIVVVPENLRPKPANGGEVEAAVAEFHSLAGLEAPRFEGFRYVLPPAIRRS